MSKRRIGTLIVAGCAGALIGMAEDDMVVSLLLSFIVGWILGTVGAYE